MEIEKNIETLKACRYCPMCRHVCTSGNLSYHESDYPRGRGLILDKIYNNNLEYNTDIVNAIYNCFLCGCCWSNCESDYKMHELIKSARIDIVNSGFAPQITDEIRNKMFSGKNLFGNNNTAYKVEERKAGLLYLMGDNIKFNQHGIVRAVEDLLSKLKIDYTLLNNEPSGGKILDLLGYSKDSRELAEKLYTRIKEINPKVILVSDPLIYDLLKNDYPSYGFKITPATKIMHISQYLAKLLKDGKLKLKKSKNKVTLLDSEFLGRFNKIYDEPRKILKEIAGDSFVEMRWVKDKALAAGEAAFIFNGKLFSDGHILGEKICKEARDIGVDTIITLSPAAKENLKGCKDIKIIDIAEFVLGRLSQGV
jgi:Fe-S oxidoreductase